MRANVLLICLILTLPMLAGCTGNANGDPEADPENVTVVNNFYNNTTYTNSGNQIWYVHGTTTHVCSALVENGNNTDDGETNNNTTLKQGSPSNWNPEGYCFSDDNIEWMWNGVMNQTVIQQAANTGIILHSYSASSTGAGIGTVCSNGVITGWDLNAEDGFSADNTVSSTPDFVLPMQGVECEHYLFGIEYMQGTYDVNWHVAEALAKVGRNSVPDLVQALQDPKIRQYVVGILAKIGEDASDAVPALVQLLPDGDVNVRASAAKALGAIGKGAVDAVPSLVQLLPDEDTNVRINAAEALAEIGRDAVPALVQLLPDEDTNVRASAVWTLAKIGKAAVPALIQTLQDKNAQTRISAAGILGQIETLDAAPTLIQALQDPDSRVRREAALALGHIAAVDAVSALIQLLQDENEYVRFNAVSALKQIGTTEALKAAEEYELR